MGEQRVSAELAEVIGEADKAKQADTGRYWMDIAGELEAENERLLIVLRSIEAESSEALDISEKPKPGAD